LVNFALEPEVGVLTSADGMSAWFDGPCTPFTNGARLVTVDDRGLTIGELAAGAGTDRVVAAPAWLNAFAVKTDCDEVATTPDTIPAWEKAFAVSTDPCDVAAIPDTAPACEKALAVSTNPEDVAGTPEATPACENAFAPSTWAEDVALGLAVVGVTGVVVGVIAFTTPNAAKPAQSPAAASAEKYQKLLIRRVWFI
jgi:hypothetical protein